MKTIFLALTIIVTTMGFGLANAETPFEVSGTGVDVPNYFIDSEVNSVIFEVQVNESQGVLELTFDRIFLDSVSLENDDEFFVLIDGERLPYIETNTSDESRTIQTNLSSGEYEIEVFGSHLLGKTVGEVAIISEVKQENTQLQDENKLLSKQVSALSVELSDVKTENNALESENEELAKTIFSPDNLISETEVQATNLISETEVQASNLISETEEQTITFASVISQQITAFTAWFESFFV